MVVKFSLGAVFCIASSCSVTEASATWGHPGIYLVKKLKDLPRESNLILRKKGKKYTVEINPESRFVLNTDDHILRKEIH